MAPNGLAALAQRASKVPGSVSWDEVHATMQREAKRRGEWAGLPMPIKGTRMVIHPSYAFAESLNQVFDPEPSVRVCRNSDVDESVSLRNHWSSYRDGKGIEIWHDKKGYFFTYSTRQNQARMLLDTLGAARAWDYEAELRAMETLRRHISEWAFQCYMMSGTFLETSPRSQVTYMFRRLRPTVAITFRPDRKGRDCGARILCTLCAHPIGFYDGTWAGALVPTDDVIAHLLMMRSDEHYMWRMCNQHHPWAPESGL